MTADEKREYPLRRSALKSVIVYQFTVEIVRGTKVELPATNLNPIGIYSEKQYTEHSAKGGLFERVKIKHRVWHKPGQEGTVQTNVAEAVAE